MSTARARSTLACRGVWRAVVATMSRAAASAGAAPRDLLQEGEQGTRAWVFARVEPVAEAGDTAAGPQLVRDHGGRAAPVEHVEQQLVREPAGRAVQGALQDAEPGGDGRVRVRAGRGGDADREGRGGEVVVDEQAECGVQGAQ